MKKLTLMVVMSGLFVGMAGWVLADSAPKILSEFLEPEKITKGEVVKMEIDSEFNKFTALLAQAKQKDPAWYKEHLAKSDPKNPIPLYDAKLGMTKAEYDKYVKLWEKRKYKRVNQGRVELMLTALDKEKGEWAIQTTGKGLPISLLKFRETTGDIVSTNGVMKRIADIHSPATGLYREWNGYEWRYYNEGSLVKIKENFAIGRTGDKRYGILIYSLQEVSGAGTPLADDLIIIRFVPKKVKK